MQSNETEKEWWRADPYMKRGLLSDWFDLEGIVHEATSRARAEVLEEVRKIIKKTQCEVDNLNCGCDLCITCDIILSKLEAIK